MWQRESVVNIFIWRHIAFLSVLKVSQRYLVLYYACKIDLCLLDINGRDTNSSVFTMCLQTIVFTNGVLLSGGFVLREISKWGYIFGKIVKREKRRGRTESFIRIYRWPSTPICNQKERHPSSVEILFSHSPPFSTRPVISTPEHRNAISSIFRHVQAVVLIEQRPPEKIVARRARIIRNPKAKSSNLN